MFRSDQLGQIMAQLNTCFGTGADFLGNMGGVAKPSKHIATNVVNAELERRMPAAEVLLEEGRSKGIDVAAPQQVLAQCPEHCHEEAWCF